MDKDKIITEVSDYYNKKLQLFGTTAKGVDWNSESSQELRFQQLINVIEKGKPFSILDYGCGFGAMYPFLEKNYGTEFSFAGFDISSEMIEKAQELNKKNNAQWIDAIDRDTTFDYVVSSGIFNVRLENKDEEWENYILDTLQHLNSLSRKGFSFNMLTSYSDKAFLRDYLYYGNPTFYFDYCKRYFSKYISLLHDYPLYEFTIIVKKN